MDSISRIVQRYPQGSASLSNTSRPQKKPVSAQEAQSLGKVYERLEVNYGTPIAEVVRTQLFGSTINTTSIDPEEIQLANKLAQGFQSTFSQIKKQRGREAAEHAFATVFDSKAKLPPVEHVEDAVQELAPAAAENFIFENSILETLVTKKPEEQKKYIQELRSRGLSLKGSDPYEALLCEVLLLTLELIEPYVPLIEPYVPKEHQAIIQQVMHHIKEAAALNQTFQTFNRATANYRILKKQALACESFIRTLNETPALKNQASTVKGVHDTDDTDSEDEEAQDQTWHNSSNQDMVEGDLSSTSDRASASIKESDEDADAWVIVPKEAQLEKEQLQKEIEQAQEELTQVSVQLDQLKQSLPEKISFSLVAAYGTYQMVAAGEVHPSQLPFPLVEQVHRLANLTLYGAPQNSTQQQAATTVQMLTEDVLYKGEEGWSLVGENKGQITAPTAETEVLASLEKIRAGIPAAGLAKEWFAGDDRRRQAIAFLSERQQQVIQRGATAAAFDGASQELLFQLKMMNLSPGIAALKYRCVFGGGQDSTIKAKEQAQNMTELMCEMEEALKIYQNYDHNYQQQLSRLGTVPADSSSIVAAVTSVTKTLIGFPTREFLEDELEKNKSTIVSLKSLLQEATLQQKIWSGIAAICEQRPDFLNNVVHLRQEMQALEVRRTASNEPKDATPFLEGFATIADQLTSNGTSNNNQQNSELGDRIVTIGGDDEGNNSMNSSAYGSVIADSEDEEEDDSSEMENSGISVRSVSSTDAKKKSYTNSFAYGIAQAASVDTDELKAVWEEHDNPNNSATGIAKAVSEDEEEDDSSVDDGDVGGNWREHDSPNSSVNSSRSGFQGDDFTNDSEEKADK